MPPGDREIFRSSDTQQIWGVRLGVVQGSDDPLAQNRVEVLLPWLGSRVWALVAYPPGVAASKFLAGDQVVLAFESGDPHHPIVLGRVGS
jgi:hypothetical protein